MKFSYISFFVGLVGSLFFQTVYAQENPIKVTSERNDKNEYTIWAENSSKSNYSVMLKFSTLTGYVPSNGNTDKILEVVMPGKSRITELKPIEGAPTRYFNYTVLSAKGNFNKKPDSSFVYLLPVNQKTVVKTYLVTYLGESFGKQKPDKFYAQGFFLRKTDTICASRSGVITEFIDNEKAKLNTQYYKRNTNQIEIDHKDGTIAVYKVYDNLKVLVTPGTKVTAGQPIGIISSAINENTKLVLSIIYLDQQKWLSEKDNQTLTSNITPLFCTLEANAEKLKPKQQYTAIHPEELIIKELTKREIKKRAEKKQ